MKMFVNPAGGGGGKGGADTSPVTDVNSLLAGAHLQVGHLLFLYYIFLQISYNTFFVVYIFLYYMSKKLTTGPEDPEGSLEWCIFYSVFFILLYYICTELNYSCMSKNSCPFSYSEYTMRIGQYLWDIIFFFIFLREVPL